MRKILTVQELKELDACDSAVETFEQKFGAGASISEVLDWLREIGREDWEAWILGQTIELTKAFLHYGADVHTASDEALYWAAMNNHLEIVKFLLEHGVDANAQGGEALYWAGRCGHPEVVRVLKEAIAASPV